MTSILSGVAYAIVRNALLEQSDNVALQRAFANAGVMRGAVARGESILQALQSLPREPDSAVYLLVERRKGTVQGGQKRIELVMEAFAPSVEPPYDSLPSALRESLRLGRTGRQRFVTRDESQIAVGVALRQPKVAYVEVGTVASEERRVGFAR